MGYVCDEFLYMRLGMAKIMVRFFMGKVSGHDRDRKKGQMGGQTIKSQIFYSISWELHVPVAIVYIKPHISFLYTH